MASWNYRPSKPMALLGVPVGIAMIAFALFGFFGSGEKPEGAGLPFIIFWCVMVVAITGMNLWAAYSRNGSLGVLESDEPPTGHAPGPH